MIQNYKILDNGVIKQINIVNKIKEYNIDYVSERYNTYGEKGIQMSFLRLGYLLGVIGEDVTKILDVGYGNGDFLKACLNVIPQCYGNDISGYPIPDGCMFVEDILIENFDVVCFFDCLEHFEDINFVARLKAKYVYISLPWCHNYDDDWFKNWKHRRTDEHLWHFNDQSLINFMEDMGYKKISISNVEDVIRKSDDSNENILTGIFQKNTQ